MCAVGPELERVASKPYYIKALFDRIELVYIHIISRSL